MAKVCYKFYSEDSQTDQLALPSPEIENKIVVSIPYLGTIYHQLARKAKHYGITLVPKTTHNIWSVLPKLKTPTPLTQRSGVVYGIACSCGKKYVGQTGREISTRAEEHRKSWTHNSGAFQYHPSPIHEPNFNGIRIITNEKSMEIREVKEAFLINQCGNASIENANIGHRSTVNRNRGLTLNENYILVIARFPDLDLS